ncbi:Uncharacterized protein C31H12.03c [Golovinomyces cichoracearum]|uniref:Uncharacterized protein C31H12.03c n=1 Tax=Golovinomyces cichoracearum TaxID=62708 RepID=A0A420IW88_9PEZI|nr:Uncharacterized protein C31H12.03c [Golovinomyces cichoracearum]
MAIEYPSLKVPDLKKLLQERGLAVSGNKAELISKLVEDDKKSAIATAGEDEIDWEEDDKMISTAPAPTTAAPSSATHMQTKVSKTDQPVSKLDDQNSKKKQKVIPEEPSVNEKSQKLASTEGSDCEFALGLGQSDTITEAEKRAARAKRFGLAQSEEAIKMAERAKKFRLPSHKDEVVQSLDAALPERRPKRMRHEKDKLNSRPEKRNATDRRVNNDTRNNNNNAGLNKMKIAAILDDPIERAKAEARAKRFSRPVVT